MQLLEVEFVAVMDSLTKSTEPVREIMTWADKCCERLMGSSRANHSGQEERNTMSSRSVLIRWGYVTSQVMRDLVSFPLKVQKEYSDCKHRQFAAIQLLAHSRS